MSSRFEIRDKEEKEENRKHNVNFEQLSSGQNIEYNEDMSGKDSPLPLPTSKYEDVDQGGKSIIVLTSGLQRTTPDVPPPRHLNMEDKEKDHVDRRNEESDRKYEDVDPAGEKIFILGSGLQRTAPNVPPPRHLDMGEKEKKEVEGRKDQSDRKYEDVDPHGERILEESKQTGEIVDDMELVSEDPEDHKAEDKPSEEPCSEPCYEPEDNAGHKAGVSDATPQRLDMGDHIVMWPEQNDDPYSEPYYKPQETDTDEKQEEKSFGLKERAMDMWNKAKSSNVCWVLVCCGVVLTVSVVTAVVVTAYIQPGSKVENDSIPLTINSGEVCYYMDDNVLREKHFSYFNVCIANPCQHGRCVNQGRAFKCTCSPGWTGRKCQHGINECIRDPCGYGRCVNQDGGYKCTCVPGWTGQNCQQDINECTTKPCQHGICVNINGGYKCTCSPGWTGLNCQRNSNECFRKKTCQHGRCINLHGGYKCVCSPGWTGQNCQEPGGFISGWWEYSKHRYKLFTDEVTWDQANTRCKKQGANLASINNREENVFIADLIKNAGNHVWVGLRKYGRHWKWSDSSKILYSNWSPGEPNNYMRWFRASEDCVYMNYKNGKALFRQNPERGTWNDIQCDKQYPYICKKPK
ncbi:hypothetical protein Bbelb_221180 [Branchiostoma belcheri]|nr:hypothetical protein Bbelb_221180 [Branchiostoma belcheri]